MSLFVAIRPPDAAIEHLADALESIRRLPAGRDLHWQPPHLWHVTLAFLGTDADLRDAREVVADVADRLRPLADRTCVEGLRLTGAGHFGRQVLWAGLGDEAGGLSDLADVAAAVWPLLRGAAIRGDRRPWRAHLTLARARHGDVRPALDRLAGYDGPSWPVRQVHLVWSTGGPRPTHQDLAVYPLANVAVK